jgi:uncharacterized protein (DUF1015 family)
VAQVKPFRAVRFDERRAGPIESLVAPPYDVIDAGQREHLRAVSPHNVVRLTLPEDEQAAAALWSQWLGDGVLVEEERPALWWLAQEYTGPDGVERTREGLVCALRSEPYSERVVLPHERTHAGPKEGRLRLLRAVRAHLEPIFLLYDGSLDGPDGEPEVEVELGGVRSRLWRVEAAAPEGLADATLLIADGHHRYETALAFHAEEQTEESAWLLAVVVPTAQAGLTIFPTHRIAERLGDVDGRKAAGVADALAALPEGRSGVAVHRPHTTSVIEGVSGEPDAALADRLDADGISYTPSPEVAIAAVDNGAAEGALLLRAPSLQLVRELAERGETMPQKSTYFYPKLPSGLLFMPL